MSILLAPLGLGMVPSGLSSVHTSRILVLSCEVRPLLSVRSRTALYILLPATPWKNSCRSRPFQSADRFKPYADAYIAGELKHGPIALIEPGTVVIAVATQPHVAAKTISNIQETIARGAEVILFTVEGQEVSGVENIYYLPNINPLLQSVLVAIPLQLIAYHTACIKGCDVDKPRNLAKSVTVE